jgi:hypothetical protein
MAGTDVQTVPVLRVLNPAHGFLDGFRMQVNQDRCTDLRVVLLALTIRVRQTNPQPLGRNTICRSIPAPAAGHAASAICQRSRSW